VTNVHLTVQTTGTARASIDFQGDHGREQERCDETRGVVEATGEEFSAGSICLYYEDSAGSIRLRHEYSDNEKGRGQHGFIEVTFLR
jgi:hypothetical protein